MVSDLTHQHPQLRTNQLRKHLADLADFTFVDAPHLLPWYYKPQPGCDPPPPGGAPRRAWLHTPEQVLGTPGNAQWQAAPQGLDATQHTRQTEGWDACWTLLRAALVAGNYDGLLGFSQGAGIAASVVAMLQHTPLPGIHLRFVILCSGYVPTAPALAPLLGPGAPPLTLPSLHVVGGQDTEVAANASHVLFACFAPDSRQMVVHEQGHLMPRAALPQCRAFVLGFMDDTAPIVC